MRGPAGLREHCRLTDAGKNLPLGPTFFMAGLRAAMSQSGVSAPAFHRIPSLDSEPALNGMKGQASSWPGPLPILRSTQGKPGGRGGDQDTSSSRGHSAPAPEAKLICAALRPRRLVQLTSRVVGCMICQGQPGRPQAIGVMHKSRGSGVSTPCGVPEWRVAE